MPAAVPPGSTIGLLGGGQLGRMFGIAARRMGYRVHTYESAPDSPAGQISDREFTGSYLDEKLIREFAESVDVITFEFENIPASVVDYLSGFRPVHPRSEVLHICQNREREKLFLQKHGYPHARFLVLNSPGELEPARQQLQSPVVIKTADFGYDGKGQMKVGHGDPLPAELAPEQKWTIEEWIDFRAELSVVCARDQRGHMRCFPVAENIHRRHILDHSIAPARLPQPVQVEAQRIAQSIADQLDVVGLLAVEFFLTGEDRLLVNELAPRPHNSGHFSFDACLTSQFEQQLRAVCGHPLGSPELLSPVTMVNLLGDLWQDGQAPDWRPLLANPYAKMHLYGKMEGRPGRKMGHFCVLRPTVNQAVQAALEIRTELFDATW